MPDTIEILNLYGSLFISFSYICAGAGGLEVGSHLQICGRVQSREYTKKVDEESVEKRVAYEVSVNKIDLVEEE